MTHQGESKDLMTKDNQASCAGAGMRSNVPAAACLPAIPANASSTQGLLVKDGRGSPFDLWSNALRRQQRSKGKPGAQTWGSVSTEIHHLTSGATPCGASKEARASQVHKPGALLSAQTGGHVRGAYRGRKVSTEPSGGSTDP